MSKNIKIVLFSFLFLLMLGTTIWASLQQNLLTEFSLSGSPMWFTATLIDFYINQFIIWLWVVYLEPKNWLRFFWLVIFICTGSMGTAVFALQRVIFNKPLFQRNSL